ncbi:uncharacterized protein PAN0_002c1039 [Moesziomyces antarcticus]|uniref:uncharacterized protein n=1 Tax=Pseudozyma antarctica TaxID=84753 RepID=UPI0007196A10|nr:uncharacterized protein PAN0_002c1039 [Moesziomyces antarcticus]GAK62837.1 hypothetical protein PAN0_002c1039 [Moesziomyces antarcticus]
MSGDHQRARTARPGACPPPRSPERKGEKSSVESRVRRWTGQDRQSKRPKAETEAQVVSSEWQSTAAGAQWTPGYRMGGERIQESSNKRSVEDMQTARAGAVQGSTVRDASWNPQ